MLRGMPDATLRIGELARRSGVSADLLRAWERRYALLEPSRSPAATGSTPTTTRRACDRCKAISRKGCRPQRRLAVRRRRLRTAVRPSSPEWSALDAFDDAGAQAAFDRLLATFSIETVAEAAILPYLRTLGDRWRDGDASVAQEHFAIGLLRARLLGLARGWDRGAGPRALLACPSGERHDLGLIILGLALRDRGWRVTFLGPDTPTLAAAADQLAPDVVALSRSRASRSPRLSPRSGRWPPRGRAVAGPGADVELAERSSARLLAGNPIEAANDVRLDRRLSERELKRAADGTPRAAQLPASAPA